MTALWDNDQKLEKMWMSEWLEINQYKKLAKLQCFVIKERKETTIVSLWVLERSKD